MTVTAPDLRFDAWLGELEARHLAELTFPEVSRALRALSSTYVEHRQRLAEGAALSGAGKRAAFALFYAPLHYLLVRAIVHALPRAAASLPILVDLGCGTGASGAAWASSFDKAPRLVGIDRHPWALTEAARTYRAFGLSAKTRQGDAGSPLPKERGAILAAFTVNELPEPSREALLGHLLEHAANGDAVLIVEPIAGFVARWWGAWRTAFLAAGGQADEWRFRAALPPIVAKLNRAAGLNRQEMTGRSLWIKPR